MRILFLYLFLLSSLLAFSQTNSEDYLYKINDLYNHSLKDVNKTNFLYIHDKSQKAIQLLDSKQPSFSEHKTKLKVYFAIGALLGLGDEDLFDKEFDNIFQSLNQNKDSELRDWCYNKYGESLFVYGIRLSSSNTIRCLNKSLKAFYKLSNYQSNPVYRQTLLYFAHAYKEVNVEKALALLQDLLELERNTSSLLDSLDIKTQIANMHKELGNFDIAKNIMLDVIDDRESKNLEDEGTRVSYHVMSSLCIRMNDLKNGLFYSKKTLELTEKLHGTESLPYATNLMNYGVYTGLGVDVREGISALSKAFRNKYSNKLECSYNLATMYCRAFQPDSCYLYLKTYLDLQKDKLIADLNNLSIEDRTTYLRTECTVHTLFLAVNLLDNYPTDGRFTKLAYDCLLDYRNLLFKSKFNTQLNRKDLIVSTDSIRKYLLPNDVAIEIKEVERENSYPLYYALVLKRDWPFPKFIVLDYLKLFFEFDKASKTYLPLYENVWKKLIHDADLIDGNRLFMAMDGYYEHYNIGCISDYNEQYMEDRFDIVRLSSTKNIPYYSQKDTLSSCAVYGGLYYKDNLFKNKKEKEISLFTRNISCNDTVFHHLRSTHKYLPWSYMEAIRIHKLLKGKGINSKILTGNDGTEKDFRMMIKDGSPSLLHIASHGLFKYYDELDSIQRKNIDFDKFYLDNSSILLANNNGNNDVKDFNHFNDGMLTASEIINMDFSNTKLLVLSGCNTARGGTSDYGSLGIAMAFKLAGAKTIICTTDKVDDAATCFFMTEFYKCLFEGHSYRDSFKTAKNKLKSSSYFNDIKYWSPFIIID